MAAKEATKTVPIVFLTGADPVAAGLVGSIKRPGGNLTGVTTLGDEVGPKRLELLHESIPKATVVGVLVNPKNPNGEVALSLLQTAARALGVQVHVLHASAKPDFGTVFTTLARLRVNALLIVNDPFFISESQRLADLTLGHTLPAIFYTREFAAAGGLMSYGGDLTDSYRLVGAHTGRILKGEKPAELPVQQATKVELIINLKSAKTLGVAMPTALLVRADEVIE